MWKVLFSCSLSTDPCSFTVRALSSVTKLDAAQVLLHIYSAESEFLSSAEGGHRDLGLSTVSCTAACLKLMNLARLEPAFQDPKGLALHPWFQGSRALIPMVAFGGLA